MKKTIRLASRFLLCSIVAVSLSGCGDDDKNDDPKPKGTDDPPSDVIIPEGFVDLGLSVFWAECNIGAENPEDYGKYYAWGEIAEKESFDEKNSQWYNVSDQELKAQGVVDGNGILSATYDVATQILGSAYRMPTKKEFQELKDDCTWTWEKQNEVSGYKIVGKNGNYIFLPAGGFYSGSYLENSIAYGYYWTSTEEESNVSSREMQFNSATAQCMNNSRSYGLTVRAVAPKSNK